MLLLLLLLPAKVVTRNEHICVICIISTQGASGLLR